MYCTCSNKNNYEVISLCDVKSFTDKNGPFDNKAWVQISVADILMIDCSKYSIEKIEKVYIDVSIPNTKIIETPISNRANSEGMILTGKKLLLDGFICSTIVYTALTKEQSVYTSKFVVPFCTYIVIEETADPYNDIYCIKSCIEDVFLSLIDCKTIFQNITLFILAEKTSITCPNAQPPKEDCTIAIRPPEPPPCDEPLPPSGQTPSITNVITIKDKNITTNIATISFDTTTKQIKANSTGTNSTSDPNYPANFYLLFNLRDCNKIIKKDLFIRTQRNADNFQLLLNGTNFKYGDIIELEILFGRTVEISDLPTTGQTEILGENAEIGTLIKKFYRIEYNGLKEYTPNPPIITPSLPNIIKIYSVTDNTTPLVSIGFDTQNSMLITTFKNASADRGSSYNYITFKLFNTLNQVVANVTFDSQQNAPLYIDPLIKLLFLFNYTIELTYSSQAKPNVTITNFPNQGQNHTPINSTEYFKITNLGLVPYTPPLPNIITLKSKNNLTVLTITIVSNTFMVNSTKEIADNTLGNVKYFSLLLQDENGFIKINTAINANENGDAFTNALNNTIINENDLLTLTYTDNSKVFISNYNSQSQYTPQGNLEQFIIKANRLSPNTMYLKNTIILKNTRDENLLSMQFDKANNLFKATATNNVTINNDIADFNFTNTSSPPIQISTTNNQTATNVANRFNNLPYAFNDLLQIHAHSETIPMLFITNYNNEDIFALPARVDTVANVRFKIQPD